MSTPLFSIGGVASGLDTQAILRELLRLERQPVVRLQQRQADLRRIDDAWGKVTTQLSALRAALDAVRRPEALAGHVTATSSEPDAVGVAVDGAPTPSSTTFSVQRLAAAHEVAVGGTFGSADDRVGAGTVTVRGADGSVLAEVTTTDTTTVRELADVLDAAGSGVGARVVKVADGAYRLVLTAQHTGAGGRFSVDADPASLQVGTEVLRDGVDAHLRLGTLDVYRSSNTVTDLVDGLTLTLRRTTAADVTVTTERDVDGAVQSIRGLVDALNGALSTAKELSAYDVDSRRAAALQGDATLRRLAADLRTAVSSAVAGLDGAMRHAGAVGISLERDGGVRLDEATLRAALVDDFDAVGRLLARAGTASGSVSYLSATDGTEAGTYEVRVTRAAKVAAATGAVYVPPAGEPKLFTITTADGEVVTVSIDTTDTTATAAVARINDALAAAGVTTVSASVVTSPDGDALHLAERRHGAAHSFAVEEVDAAGQPTGGTVFGLEGSHAGVDVAGTIGGLAATGRGRILTGTDGAATGLSLRISATQGEVDAAAGDLLAGTATLTLGVGGALDRVLRQFEGPAGAVARARQTLSDEIRRHDERIAEFEVRLDSRETTLRRQFTAMESAMGRLQSQSAWLSAQLAGLNSPRG